MRIETAKLARSFGPTKALAGVDLAIPSGRRVGLVGPNGSGKSTLIRILMGLLQHEGEVRIDGFDPLVDRVRLAPALAYVPQVAPAFAAPTGELVAAVCGLRRVDPRRVETPAKALGLDLATLAGTPFRTLSGGMKQKLLIAVALAAEARLLILDEPTASLDARSRDRCLRLLSDLPRETTVVLCSHRLEEMRHLIDHVVSLEEGTVRFQGAASEFLGLRALAVITAHAQHGSAPWLRRLGFREGATGWFEKTVDHGEKLRLLPDLSDELGAGLLNLHVRDLDHVDLTASADATASATATADLAVETSDSDQADVLEEGVA